MADVSTAANTAPNTGGPVTGSVFATPTPVSVIPQALQGLQGNRNLIYPLEIPKYYMRFKVSDYSRTSLLRLGALNEVGNIILPLPQQLIDAHNVSYEQQNLGPMVGGVIQGFSGIGNPEAGRTTASEAAAVNQVQRNTQAGAVAALGAGQTLLGSLAGTFLNPARAFWGMSPNQFLTILLQGPRYKTFELNWNFSPKTEQESERLRQIKRDLNNYMAPGLALGGAVFTFPKIFTISIMPNSKYMYKFKPAVLTSLTMNYTPGNQPSFYKARPGTDNLPAPAGIALAMSFIELEYWLDGDFKDNNNPYDIDNPRAASGTGGGINTDPGTGLPTGPAGETNPF